MKKAKEEFDKLVEKIKAGEKVSFGQMEKVYAGAFLERFLEGLPTKEGRKKLEEKLLRESIAVAADIEGMDPDEVDPEQISVDSEQVIAREVDNAGIVIGALGVRPSINLLMPYIDEAVKGRDWDVFERVVSISAEGISNRTAGKIALSYLLKSKDVVEITKGQFYDKTRSREMADNMKEHFPEIEFSPEDVQEVYRHTDHSISSIMELTGIPPTRDIVNGKIEEVFEIWRRGEQENLRYFLYLNELRGEPVRVTDELSGFLAGEVERYFKKEEQSQEKTKRGYEEADENEDDENEEESYRNQQPKEKEDLDFGFSENESETLEKLSSQFAYSNKKLSLSIQRKLLEMGRYGLFLQHFEKTPYKMSERELQDAYEKIRQ